MAPETLRPVRVAARRPTRAVAARPAIYAALTLAAALYLVPLLIMVLTSFKTMADIQLRAPLRLVASVPRWRRVGYDTQPVYVLENPIARAEIRRYLSERAGIGESDADRALDHCANSFFGIFTTLERRLRISIPKAEVAELLSRINDRMDRETARSGSGTPG